MNVLEKIEKWEFPNISENHEHEALNDLETSIYHYQDTIRDNFGRAIKELGVTQTLADILLENCHKIKEAYGEEKAKELEKGINERHEEEIKALLNWEEENYLFNSIDDVARSCALRALTLRIGKDREGLGTNLVYERKVEDLKQTIEAVIVLERTLKVYLKLTEKINFYEYIETHNLEDMF